MRLNEYELMESNLRIEKVANIKKGMSSSMIAALLLLIGEAKELLFDSNGKYRKLKWTQFRRIWGLAKVTIRLINTLMGIFGKGMSPEIRKF